MAEKFTKDNDYTLSVTREETSECTGSNSSEKIKQFHNLTKTFNFLSAQVTIIQRDTIFQPRGMESGGSASVSTQMIVQNFSDIQSFGEIRLMHQKLIEMGGHPPGLSDVLPILDKKPTLRRPE